MSSIFDDQPTPPPSNVVDQPKRSRTRDLGRERLSASEVNRGKRRLAEGVEFAFDTLERAMECADWQTAVKAATAYLDRAGFGPRSNMEAPPASARDLTELSREDLADYAHKIAMLLKSRVATDKAARVAESNNEVKSAGQVH